MSEENMKLWNDVEKTDPKHTKKAKIGQMHITSICPQYQRMNATAKFGPYGIGWGIEHETWLSETIGETTLCTYVAELWYKLDKETGRFPINANIKVAYVTNGGKGYLKVDDEYAKKVQTNAMTKGLSMLGFNSDVFMGKHDDDKYVQEVNDEFNPPEPEKEKTMRDLLVDAIKKSGHKSVGSWCKMAEIDGEESYKALTDSDIDEYLTGFAQGTYNV